MKIGRNAPCPCGSGKKYKKCCLSKDQEENRASQPITPIDPSHGVPDGQGLEGGLPIHPYAIAKISEDPANLALLDKRTRRARERHLRENWTLAKVAAMSTEAIKRQLEDYGVPFSTERFLNRAASRYSAWSISDTWIEENTVTCKGKEHDFLGLAACELWKRLLSGRPSMEMLDDWMQEGYTLSESHREAESCDIWWKTWQVLHERFTPEMTTTHATEPVFQGLQSLFNWSQDFELNLGNAALRDVEYASMGHQYFQEWLDQFTDEGDDLQMNFRRALASSLLRLGRKEEGKETLLQIVETWPRSVWGYAAMADAYSHSFPGAPIIEHDLDRAIEWLEKGLETAPPNARNRDVLSERLEILKRETQS